MIIRYVKEKGKPIGCVIGLAANQVGWSLCCKKDIFNKQMARTIAKGRAENGFARNVPQKIIKTYDEVYDILNSPLLS